MAEKLLPTRIHLTKSGGSLFEEGRAAATITPGMLVARDAAGELIPHNVAVGPFIAEFALEDALQGRTIDDDYVDGELVFTCLPQAGEVVYAWLAYGESVTPADFLTSNADGMLKKAATTNHRVAQPLDTYDNNDSDDEPRRIRVRII